MIARVGSNDFQSDRSPQRTVLAQRSINVGGVDLTVCGRAEDPYFSGASADDPLMFCLGRIKQHSVVLDVGANIGLTAAAFASQGAVVHCFEPDPSVFRYLQATIDANGFGQRITAHHLALGAEDGELTLFNNPDSASASHLVDDRTLGQRDGIRVRVETLDGFVAANSISRIDLIKIDVEGFEIDVITGAMQTIIALRPSALIEFNAFTMIGFRDLNPRDFLRLIHSTWPYVYRIKGGAPELLASDAHDLTFLHDVLVSPGCLDDLYASFCPI